MAITDIHAWRNEILNNTNIRIFDPTAVEMVDSTLLPPHHKDPFDRLLIAQANHRDLAFITRDRNIQQYDITHFWI